MKGKLKAGGVYKDSEGIIHRIIRVRFNGLGDVAYMKNVKSGKVKGIPLDKLCTYKRIWVSLRDINLVGIMVSLAIIIAAFLMYKAWNVYIVISLLIALAMFIEFMFEYIKS